MKYIVLVLAFITVVSCNKDSKIKDAIAGLDVDVTVERFDRFFAEATESDLPKLKSAYPFMFSKKYPDSIWLNRINDTLQQQLSDAVYKAFKDEAYLQTDIKKLFQHLAYYFPKFKTPRVITTTSFVDYRNPVIVTDTIAIIALDTYLGKDHEFYRSIQNYLKQNFSKEQIVVNLAEKYAQKYIHQSNTKTLLGEMIYNGKLLYFKDQIIPFKTDAEKISYTDKQLAWANTNEEEIWRYFIEKELLYSTDSKLPSRFINKAPFTKFYLELDAESPGRLGTYIGWQIVKAYVKNNNVSFKQMLITDAETIFNKSKYKPKK